MTINSKQSSCSTDEGRPLGTGLQERVSNQLQRLWSKAMVVSAEGKGLARTRSGDRQEEDCQETTTRSVESVGTMSKLQGSRYCRTKLRRNLFTGGVASGVKGGLSLPRRRLDGTWEPETPMLTEKLQVQETREREYGCGDSGAEQRVVATKSPIKRWSEDAVARSLIQ